MLWHAALSVVPAAVHLEVHAENWIREFICGVWLGGLVLVWVFGFGFPKSDALFLLLGWGGKC